MWINEEEADSGGARMLALLALSERLSLEEDKLAERRAKEKGR